MADMKIQEEAEEFISVMQIIEDQEDQKYVGEDCFLGTSLKIEGDCECEADYTFDDVSFPNLKTLEINIINVDGIYFKKEAFPKLEKLVLMNINYEGECDFNFHLPKLQELSIQHTFLENNGNFENSIKKSPLLKKYYNYKFRMNKGLKLVMPNVEMAALERGELMTSLSLWAPKLSKLIVRSCWDLKTVKILKGTPREMKPYDIPKREYSKIDIDLIFCEPKISGDRNRIGDVTKQGAEEW